MSTAGVPLADSTNLPSTQPDALAAALAAVKKMQAELDSMKTVVAAFTAKKRKGKRKASAGTDAETVDSDAPPAQKAKTAPEHEQDFTTHGRIIMRFIGPFENLEEIFIHGLKGDTALLGDEIEETPEEKRLTESWTIVWQKFPGFHDLMLGIHQDLPLMSTGMEGARSDDTGTVKPRIISWIPQPPPIPPTTSTPTVTTGTCAPTATAVTPTPTATGLSTSKATRGFSDPIIALLLLPLEFLNDPEHPEPLALIVAGDLDINGLQLPCFLLPPGQVDDHSALDTVLTGPLLLRASSSFTHLNLVLTFTYQSAKGMLMGPESALQGDGWHQGKPGNVVVNGLKTFTGRIIAYIACQVRFNLSSQSQWNKLDSHFDYQVFFWHLVSLFNNTVFATRTITLYNRVVLGNAAGISPAATPSASSGMTHLQRLQASRAAADARAAAAEAEAAAAVVAAAPSAT
ncbi:hypothetical protein DFH09DRAFT_1309359 [Mycena vulgaris]|nr:hypothetical protein DFH09DRAFT_1309359 [Mycena vulgaris]